jgi:hypothetical protein
MTAIQRWILISLTILVLFSCKKEQRSVDVSSFQNLHISTATVKFLPKKYQNQAVLMLKNGDYLLPYNLNMFNLNLRDKEKVQISYVENRKLTMEGYPEGKVVILSHIDSHLKAILD